MINPADYNLRAATREEVRALFRWWKCEKHDTELGVLVLFPDLETEPGHCLAYDSLRNHHSVHVSTIMKQTIPITVDELGCAPDSTLPRANRAWAVAARLLRLGYKLLPVDRASGRRKPHIKISE